MADFSEWLKKIPQKIPQKISKFFNDITSERCQICRKELSKIRTKEGTGYYCTELSCIDELWQRHCAEHRRKTPLEGDQLCKLPGCENKAYVQNNGTIEDYCGHTHAIMHRDFLTEAQKRKTNYGHHKKSNAHGCQHAAHKHDSGQMHDHVQTGTAASKCHQSGAEKHHHYHEKADCILFYHKHEDCYEFTNFYECWIELDDKFWRSTEHYFQAQKFVGTPLVEHIRNAPSAREAFELSRDPEIAFWKRGDWESVRDKIMKKALLAKFTQRKSLLEKLKSTGSKKLIENAPWDNYWGCGLYGDGQNKLGELLMEIRELAKGGITA